MLRVVGQQCCVRLHGPLSIFPQPSAAEYPAFHATRRNLTKRRQRVTKPSRPAATTKEARKQTEENKNQTKENNMVQLPTIQPKRTNKSRKNLLSDKYFPNCKSKPLHKIFNRCTAKINYRCMVGVESVINRHNSRTEKRSENRRCTGK